METSATRSDARIVDKKVLWMCMAAGSTVGGYLPTVFGQGSFSIASILGSAVGGIAGVFAAARIDASL
jgi:outer membrane lipoprotein SlyB